jgi:hypothetical protein
LSGGRGREGLLEFLESTVREQIIVELEKEDKKEMTVIFNFGSGDDQTSD